MRCAVNFGTDGMVSVAQSKINHAKEISMTITLKVDNPDIEKKILRKILMVIKWIHN